MRAVAATGVVLLYVLVFVAIWVFCAGLKLLFGDIALWVLVGLGVAHMWWSAFKSTAE